MNNNSDLESLIDSDTSLIAFNNGVLFDIKSNTHRKIEKSDFISKTMTIPYNPTIDEKATNAIFNIVTSFFEDPAITHYFLSV